MIPDLRKHPTKPDTFLDSNGEEWTMRITGGDQPMCYGYIGADGLMHEFVCKPDGEIIRERHTPFAIWNRGGAEEIE